MVVVTTAATALTGDRRRINMRQRIIFLGVVGIKEPRRDSRIGISTTHNITITIIEHFQDFFLHRDGGRAASWNDERWVYYDVV